MRPGHGGGAPTPHWGALVFLLPASVLGLLTSALHPNPHALAIVGPEFPGDLHHLPSFTKARWCF